MSDTQARYFIGSEVVTQAQADALDLMASGTDPRGTVHPRTLTGLIERGFARYEPVTYRPVLTERGAAVLDRVRRKLQS